MELALAALLVSSLTSVGLLSLWVATSPRHWFLRTTVFAGVLSLLLLIPAYEPVVAFALQGLIVAVGIQIARWFKRTGPAPPRRFSLGTLLQVMVIASVWAAVCTKLPTSEFLIWVRAFLIGMGGGFVTFVGCWIAQGRNPRWWLRFGIGLMLVVGVSMAIAWLDWRAVEFLLPKFSWYAAAGIFGQLPFVDSTYDYADALRIWTPWFMGAICLISLLVWLASGALKEAALNLPRRRIQNSFAISFLLLLIVQLIPSAVIYYQLMTPLPIPVQNLPADNGYDDLAAAANLLEGSCLDTFDIDFTPQVASTKILRAVAIQSQPAYELLRPGLAKSIQSPINYRARGSGLIYVYSPLESLLITRATLAIREERFRDAAIGYLELLKLGFAIRHGTLGTEISTGIYITESGLCGLYQIRKEIDAEQSRQAIHLLLQLISEQEPLQDSIHRAAVLCQHAYGWHRHLAEVFEEIENPGFYRKVSSYYQEMLTEEQTLSYLLCTELALVSFRNEQGHFPEQLKELVPQYLPVVLVDPYRSEGEALKYQREGDSYVLFSLGPEGESEMFLKHIFGERPEAGSFQ